MTSATSPGVATRPSGCDRPHSATTSSVDRPLPNCAADVRSMGVSTDPGQTAFTRIPSSAWSTAIARTRLSSAPLPIEYAATLFCAAYAWTEATTTTLPPRGSFGTNAWQAKKTPPTLTAITSSYTEPGVSTTVPYRWTPAAQTSASTSPASVAIAARAARSATSTARPVTSSPSSASKAASAAASRSRATTRSPAATNRSTAPRPIPAAPPVTTTVRPPPTPPPEAAFCPPEAAFDCCGIWFLSELTEGEAPGEEALGGEEQDHGRERDEQTAGKHGRQRSTAVRALQAGQRRHDRSDRVGLREREAEQQVVPHEGGLQDEDRGQ